MRVQLLAALSLLACGRPPPASAPPAPQPAEPLPVASTPAPARSAPSPPPPATAVDYSGEPLTWEKQQRIYAPKGIPHFRDAATLERFFRVESQAPYFTKLYRPAGTVP